MNWDRVRPYVGLLCLLVGIGVFVWEVRERAVVIPFLIGAFLVALFGAWCMNPPGAQGFVTLIISIIPWARGTTTTVTPPAPAPAPDHVVLEDPPQAEDGPTGQH